MRFECVNALMSGSVLLYFFVYSFGYIARWKLVEPSL